MKTLFIGEKREAMCDMAAVLGDPKLGSNVEHIKKIGLTNGYLDGDLYQMIWAAGHLYKTPLPNEIKPEWGLSFKINGGVESYRMPEMRDIKKVPDKSQSNKKKLLETVKNVLASGNYSKIVIATDADAEGEVIGRDILAHNKHKSVPIYRMWNTGSFKTKESIDKAMAELKPLDDEKFRRLKDSGEARSICDYIVGMKATKALTDAYGKLYVVGRLQTALLALFCKRELEIKNFIPRPYWSISGKLGDINLEHFYYADGEKINEDGSSTQTKIKEKNYFVGVDKDDALKAMHDAGGSGTITVLDTKETYTKERPLPLSGGDFASEMMGRYKITYKQANDILDYLRAEGFTTYPGTNGNYFAKTDAKEVEDALKTALIYFDNAKGVDALNIKFTTDTYIFNDKKAATQNHTPLNVTSKSPTTSDLKKWENSGLPKVKEAYELIMKRILLGFLPNDKIQTQSIQIDVAGYFFQANGRKALAQGWRTFMDMEIEDSTFNTSAKIGDKVTVDEIKSKEHFTDKPKKFTVKTTLDLMANIGKAVDEMIADERDPQRILELKKQRKILKEAKGIGTDRTRETIINNLKDYKYITIAGKNNEITVEEEGWNLNKIQPAEIKDVTLTAEWEEALEAIRRGEKTKNDFIDVVDGLLMSKIIPDILQNVGKSGVSAAPQKTKSETTKLDHKCPLCGKNIVETDSIYKCETGGYKDGKPTGCPFVLFKENKILGRKITEEDLTAFLAGRELSGSGTVIVFDKTNKYFTKIVSGGSNHNADSSKKEVLGKCQCGGEILETPKTFKCNKCDTAIWKDFRGAKIGKTLALSLFGGAKPKMTLTKQGSNQTYDAFVQLKNGSLEVSF